MDPCITRQSLTSDALRELALYSADLCYDSDGQSHATSQLNQLAVITA